MRVASPLGDASVPLVVETARGGERVVIWHYAPESLWRGFCVRRQGHFISAHVLPTRGVLVVVRTPSGDLWVERLVLERDRLRSGEGLLVPNGLGVVCDVTRRRAWTVTLDTDARGVLSRVIGLR